MRDPSLPSFAGQYLFGRFDTGIIMKLGPHAAPPADDTGLNVPNVSGFGEDGVGHLYATSLGGGVYRLGESGGTLTKTSIGTLDQPVAVGRAARRDPNQLFIAEKPGRVMRWTPVGHDGGARHQGRRSRTPASRGCSPSPCRRTTRPPIASSSSTSTTAATSRSSA